MAVEMRNEILCQFLLTYCRATLDLESETYAGVTAYQLASRDCPDLANRLREFGAKWYPVDDSDESDEDDEEDDDDEVCLAFF